MELSLGVNGCYILFLYVLELSSIYRYRGELLNISWGDIGRGLSCNRWLAGLNNVSVSVVVSLDKTLHPTCLLMVVRGFSGACVWQPHTCQCAPGQLLLHCSLPLSTE
ncbi:hypothetical protein GOODEAATRI_031958 [Goodea atripinnis]|uniref:Uncharacterized protein n=1 Tax=Goodea atripinnis TaxID=208336 RepID=A0ABV0MMD7_9TELE